jgi:SAM-dependent methyltransferase
LTRRPGWLIDDRDHAGRENLDAAHVARYDAKEDASADSEVSLLQTLGLARDSLVVELGAGTGQFSVTVAPVCARVIAVDISEPMLERLASKIGDLRLGNVELVRAGFLTYEHRGDLADFIYSRYALHHLPDFWKAVALSRLRAMPSLRADRVQLPRVGNALQGVDAPIGELQSRPGHQVLDGSGDKQLLGFGLSADARCDVDGDAADVVSHYLALARVQASTDAEP